MPLASFPSTLNLTELKKGFFPHLFNTPDHQQYVDRIPDLEFYNPDGMMAKEKEELTRWQADQVRRNVSFHFHQEMIDYSKSDVALLKAGCGAFQQEFERQAGFNPVAKCITIASACNLYWRKHHLTPNTIAVEPLGGWRGANVNQSLKVLQWLYYQEHQILKQGASADRIRLVRNGAEQSVRTNVDSCFVDVYDPLTRSVYEFHGCQYHGCPRCHPSRRAKYYASIMYRTEAWKNCIKPLYPNAWLCSERVTNSSKCESVSGTVWSKASLLCHSFFTRSFSYHPWNPARPSLGDEQAQWPYMLWLGRARKYATWM